MIAWLWLGTVLVALPAVLAAAWAVQNRVLARYLVCLAAGLGGGAALAALFAQLGYHATYDPDAWDVLGNWSGLVGVVVGLGAGWVAGTVAAPAVLLRVLGIRLDGARLIVAILAGIALSCFLVYLLHLFRAPHGHPLGHAMRILAGLSSAATFVGLTLASRGAAD